jgi:hypothetical protein
VEKRVPEFVQTTYRASVAEIAQEEVGLKASVKELLDWQLEEKNGSELRKKFSALPQSQSREERFQALEKLDPQSRAQVDRYSRLQWVDLHPERIADSLATVPSKERKLSVSKDWVSLDKVEKKQEFASLLERAALGDEAAKRSLNLYSADAKTFYRIENVEKITSRHLLTLEEAKASGAIVLAVDRFLEAEYPKIRAQNQAQFQVGEGRWKPFSSVKETVAKLVFADVFKFTGDNPTRRLEAYTKEALAALKKNLEDPRYICAASGDAVAEQFKFTRNSYEIQRTAKEEWMQEEAFVMVPNQWSSIHVPEDGNISFFYFEEKKPCEKPVLEQIIFGKETLAADAQRYLAERFLAALKKKQMITIPREKE